MLSVKYINRDSRPGNFSIEQLFDNIRRQLSTEINIQNYWYSPQLGRLRSILDIRKEEADVFHITGDVNFLALGLPGNKTVITVHDVGYYENPVNKGFRKLVYQYLWLKWPLRRCKAITTVSSFTHDRLIHYFPELSGKITVIPNPVEKEFLFEDHVKVKEIPVVLCIGTGKHKNMLRFMKALKGYSCRVLLVGKPDVELEHAIKDNGITVEQYYSVSKAELVGLYHRADVLLFASLYEGFGMPIIEAQTCGLPVITSTVAAMPDSAGEGAVLVDPYDVEAIRKAVVQVLEDTALRQSLIDKGRINAQRYSLESIGTQYLTIYQKITHEL